MRPYLIALALLAGTMTGAHAASFDCAKAQKPDEIAVCGNADLSELDTEMGALWFSYRQFPFLMGANGARHDAAEEFLKTRAACRGDIDCLRSAYRARIADLKKGISTAMENVRRVENDIPASASPEPIEKIIAGYADQCQRLGGALAAGAGRPRLMSSDFDGDGEPDYVLNPQNLKCSAAATAYCGNAGCNIRIAVSGNGYRNPIDVLGGQPVMSQGESGTVVEVWVDSTNCNLEDRSKSCWERFSWKDGNLSKSYRTKPLPE
jgi:hypothetical protein